MDITRAQLPDSSAGTAKEIRRMGERGRGDAFFVVYPQSRKAAKPEQQALL